MLLYQSKEVNLGRGAGVSVDLRHILNFYYSSIRDDPAVPTRYAMLHFRRRSFGMAQWNQ
jgi:hypothetical protein